MLIESINWLVLLTLLGSDALVQGLESRLRSPLEDGEDDKDELSDAAKRGAALKSAAISRDLTSACTFTTRDELYIAVRDLGNYIAICGELNKWDVSRVTDMYQLFDNLVAFNEDITLWNTSSVTDMNNMFFQARAFNHPIGGWNTGRVTDMSFMMALASSFDQDLNAWNIAAVTSFQFMFLAASSFSQQLCWDVDNSTDTTDMFTGTDGAGLGGTCSPTASPTSLSPTEMPTGKPTEVPCEDRTFPANDCIVSQDGGITYLNASLFACENPGSVLFDPTENKLECLGRAACQTTIFKGCGTILCKGANSCVGSRMMDIPNGGGVTCDGDFACLDASMSVADTGDGVVVVCKGGKSACGAPNQATINIGAGMVRCSGHPCQDGNPTATCMGATVVAKCLKMTSQTSSSNVEFVFTDENSGLGTKTQDYKFGLYGVCGQEAYPQECYDGNCSYLTDYPNSCFASPTETPTKSPADRPTSMPTPFVVNPLCRRIEYTTFDSEDRNVNFIDDTGRVNYCDAPFGGRLSPQWEGEGWYRFQADAGTQMPEVAPPPGACGTTASGWLNGTHPTVREGFALRQICFSLNGSAPCAWESLADVVNCGEFFLYKLQNPPACSLRYCGRTGVASATPTVAPTDFPTVTATNFVHPQCTQPYNVLNRTDRSRFYRGGSGSAIYCDAPDSTAQLSPQWQGPGWYRFDGEAGTVMTMFPPMSGSCGTLFGGWLNGTHPDVDSGVVTRPVCFGHEGDPCPWTTIAQIVNCTDFFLYKLRDAPDCSLRYCGNNSTIPARSVTSVLADGP